MSDQKQKAAKSPTGKKKAATGKKDGSSAKASSTGSTGKDSERRRLQAELAAAQATLKVQEAAVRTLQSELEELRQQHAQEASTAADVLASQQCDKQHLQEAVRQLERQLEAAQRESQQLQAALVAEQQAAVDAHTATEEDQAGQPSNEMQRMLSCSRRQEQHIAAQQQDIEELKARLAFTEAQLSQSVSTAAALQVKAQSRSELHFIKGAPWLLHVGRERLSGASPTAAQPGWALAAAGRRLVLEGAAPGGGGPALHTLDLASGTWCSASSSPAAAAAAAAAPVVGRAVCSVGSKLLGFGGMSGGQLLENSTMLLLPDLQQWLPAPPPADPAALPPPPRHSGALAYCPISNAAYLYGGQGASGVPCGDLWRYDLQSGVWTRLDTAATACPQTERARTPCIEAPAPCTGAALAVAPDGSRLWLMGGRLESGRCSSALHWFDLRMSYWAHADVEHPVEPRTKHAMACIGRFVVVAGGITHSASGTAVHRQEVCLFDSADGTWEQLDAAAFEPSAAGSGEAGAVVRLEAGRSSRCSSRGDSNSSGSGTKGGSCRQSPDTATPFLGAGSCAFSGCKMLLLKPSPDNGLLSELWSVDLQLPESIEQMRQAKKASTSVVPNLQLVCDAVTATSIQLSWRAPTANSDKLQSFKLMATNSEGRAREVYLGGETSCDVQGLAPASELVFCVKALYDDAQFIWSEPLLVTTAAAAGKKKPAPASGSK